MRHIPKKQTFLEVALQVERFHLERIKDNSDWSMSNTATALGRSVAGVSKYLKVASWNRTHSRELEQCDNLKEALDIVKQLDRDRLLRGLQE